jgi:5-methylcytosine-specific restriction endonuclease McrA
MIKLQKGPCPVILQNNRAGWTAALIAAIAAGRSPTKTERGRYNEASIKASLVSETHSKCAYCESKLRHVAYGDTEHIAPKSADPNHWFDWSNLTLACDRCNTNKGEHTDVIDPYVVDPEDYLWFAGALVFGRPGSDDGMLSERRLKLNRDDLLERRSERLKGLVIQLDRISRVQNPAVRDALKSDFLEETTDDKEYAAMAREIVRNARSKGILP